MSNANDNTRDMALPLTHMPNSDTAARCSCWNNANTRGKEMDNEKITEWILQAIINGMALAMITGAIAWTKGNMPGLRSRLRAVVLDLFDMNDTTKEND